MTAIVSPDPVAPPWDVDPVVVGTGSIGALWGSRDPDWMIPELVDVDPIDVCDVCHEPDPHVATILQLAL